MHYGYGLCKKYMMSQAAESFSQWRSYPFIRKTYKSMNIYAYIKIKCLKYKYKNFLFPQSKTNHQAQHLVYTDLD